MTALQRKAARLGIKPPGPATLRRYGLTAADWLGLLAAQGWVCGICQERGKFWNTDHEHWPGWKRLPPAERARYVRGILCAHCNYQKAPSRLALTEAENLLAYLRAYEARKDAA